MDSRTEIEISLKNEMESKGLIEPYYQDLLLDYMSLYDAKMKCIKDIEERGVCYQEKTGIWKDNKSVDKQLKINSQMLKILEYLRINPALVVDAGDDDVL